MKKLIGINGMLAVAMALLIVAGCKKSFLDEYNPANRTTDNYYSTAAGYEGLVTSCYPLLRNITQIRTPYMLGTDLFSAGGWAGTLYFPGQTTQSGSVWDSYDIGLNSTVGELQSTWDLLYREINRCNAAVDRAPAVLNMADSIRNQRVGEAKFLRALSYFWAVQLWGDVPMPLSETVSASLEVKKAPAKDVYSQVITDLNDAIAKLPVVQKDAGRATKGAAKFLLARVYLTRGWNFNNALGGSPADFTSALALCDELISSGLYPMETNWNNLWPIHNKNPKICGYNCWHLIGNSFNKRK
jgi:hypothetical protein